MQFKDHPQQQDLCSDADYWASTNINTYTITMKVRNANFGLSEATRKITKADKSWKHISTNSDTIPIDVTDLVANVPDYSLSSKHVKISRVRIKNKQGVFVTLNTVTEEELTDEDLNTTGVPTKAVLVGGSVLLYPMPDYGQDEGVELTYQPWSNDYFTVDDDVKEPGFNPDFHRLISLYMARDYCAIFNPKRLALIMDQINRMETDIENHFEERNDTGNPRLVLNKNKSVTSTLLL